MWLRTPCRPVFASGCRHDRPAQRWKRGKGKSLFSLAVTSHICQNSECFGDRRFVRFIREDGGHPESRCLSGCTSNHSDRRFLQVIFFVAETVFPAVIADRALGEPYLPGDRGVPVTCPPEGGDPDFLFVCHGNHPVLRFLTFLCPKMG